MSARHPRRDTAPTATDLAVHITALEQQLALARQTLAAQAALTTVLVQALVYTPPAPAHSRKEESDAR